MSLEEKLDILADYFAANRATNWVLGDQSADCVRQFGRAVIGKIAEVGRCTGERIKQLIRVSATFPEEKRYSDVDWSCYRAVIHAAKRLGKNPLEVLDYVLEHEMSAAEIAKLGVDERRRVRVSKTCDWCTSKVTVVADGVLRGDKVYCPVCIAENLNVGLNPESHKYVLGVLE